MHSVRKCATCIILFLHLTFVLTELRKFVRCESLGKIDSNVITNTNNSNTVIVITSIGSFLHCTVLYEVHYIALYSIRPTVYYATTRT